MTTPPELPFTTVHVDLCGPWPSGDHLLTVVDQTSRYPVSKILRSTTTTKVIDALHEDFTTFGFPEMLVSDNGPQFKSHEFQRYCRQYGIRHAPVTPLHPRANGEVERFFRTTKKTIRCAIQEGRDWKTEYQRFLFNYRDAKHATTVVPTRASALGLCFLLPHTVPRISNGACAWEKVVDTCILTRICRRAPRQSPVLWH